MNASLKFKTCLSVCVMVTCFILSASAATFRPADFGAMGDGVTNDTAALSAMADAVNQAGGGTIEFEQDATYLVGNQTAQQGSAHYSYEPDKIMEFVNCTEPLILVGNSAKIKCAGGLKFGTFDPLTGLATYHQMPYYGTGEVSSPYRWMIKVEGAQSDVLISDLELDGNLNHLDIGGPWGDTGRQLPATGIGLYNNSGAEQIVNVYSHHHALDGIIIDGVPSITHDTKVFEGVICEYNARQGLSVVGGHGYDFLNCKFNNTGKAGLASAPCSGVDMEAEGGKTVRYLYFKGCQFSNNTFAGMVADSGPSERITFEECTFVGTTNWAAWPNKPRIKFIRSRFVGPIVHAYGHTEAPLATKFIECEFLDDPQLSPTGELYGQQWNSTIADLYGGINVSFTRCNFNLTHDHVLPWNYNTVIYEDCTMSQVSTTMAFPRGSFYGNNTINGAVDLYSYINHGYLVVNGVVFP